MPHVQTNGTRLHYLQVGAGEDMILLHGLGGNLAVWFLQLTESLKSDYRLTAYDMRGHGRSDAPEAGYTTRDMAEDLLGLMDALGMEKAHLAGHSWGADVAMHFTTLYPERVDKLVLLEPNIAALIEWRKSETWEGWAYWADRLREEGVDVPPEKAHDVDFLLRQTLKVPIKYGPCKGRPRQDRSVLRLLEGTSIVTDYEKVAGLTLEAIRGISRPTLALYGTKSHFKITYEYLRDNVPNCQTELLPDCDHYGPLENQELFIKHLLPFLRDEEVVAVA
jgi:pimeloyl-ACP methyl ester carboxylesterase